VDTLNRPDDRSKLNPWSGAGYEVFKTEVDLLYNSTKHPMPMPYFYTVELQIYTLESYLRTVHSAHYANHQTFKRREFLQGLCPYLFPAVIYGEEVLQALVNGGSGGAANSGGKNHLQENGSGSPAG
jgi:hypothetical protein